MTDQPRVDVDRLHGLLAELEQHWRRQQAPIADLLAPGIPAEQAQALADEIGVRLPVEVLTWFGWHNGVTKPPQGVNFNLGPSWEPLTLESAIRRHGYYRESAEETSRRVGIPEWTPDYLWSPHWLPLALSMGASTLTVDCQGPPDAPAPVLVVDWEDLEFRIPRRASLTELVATFVLFFDQQLWWWDADANRWEDDFPNMPLELRRTALT